MKLLALIVILFIWKTTEGAINNVTLEKCCLEGMQWASSDSSRCDNYPSLVAGISRGDQRQCRTILEVCCMKKKQRTQCQNGKTAALDSRRCAIRDDEFGSEQYKECCHCCQLGLSVKNMNGDCNLLKKASFGGPCDDTFNECCVGRAQNFTRTTTTPANDINECQVHAGRLCSQVCVNTVGSFRCECYDGYTLDDDGTSCKQDQESRLTCDRYNPCQQLCVEDDTGISCACNVGYELTSDKITCQDIDECTSNTAICPPGYNCVNENGSYRCELNQQRCPSGTNLNRTTGNCDPLCGDGYIYNYRTNQCDDIDECARRMDNCTTEQRCENTQGSFTCRRILGCGTGYSLMEKTQECVDIDECALGTHSCRKGYDCVNVKGSFRCKIKTCPPNYSYSHRTEKCEYIQCPRGRRADSRGICVDIDECRQPNAVCKQGQRCVNTVGSYVCRDLHNCGHGYEPNPNAPTTCQDIDECTKGTHNCKQDQKCINRPGSFICDCAKGYRLDAQRKCRDINECLRNECPYNADCVNTIGSFTCTCRSGLRKQGRMCVDINECEDKNRCQHGCTNIVGSYHCTCPSGYILEDDKRTCKDIDECQTYQSRGRICGGECINTPGSYRCSCPAGWRSLGGGRSCQDIDECAEGTDVNCMGSDQMCFNTRGSYKCPDVSCPSGFVRTSLGPGRNSEFVIQDGLLCKKSNCAQYDTSCITNKTRTVVWQFIALPSISSFTGQYTLIDISIPFYYFIRLKMNIISGNEEGYFKIELDEEKGKLQLIRPVQGPKEFHLVLRLEKWNLLQNILFSVHITNVLIDIAPEMK